MSKKIKKETIYRIVHLPGEEIDPEQEFDHKHSYREFDEMGNLLVEIAYTQEGEIADRITHRYDQAGQLTETLVYGDDDEVLERKEVIRNNDGRIVREITHYMDGSADFHEYFYDDKGNLTGMEVKDDEEGLELSEKYFHESENVVKMERWNGDNELIFSQEDTYSNGVISGRKIWSSEEEEPFTIIQQFNPAGHSEQELRYNSHDQLIERNIYEEDGNGRVVRIIEENRQRKNTTELVYDKQGNVIHQSETDLNGQMNHQIFRVYGPDSELLQTTVETIIKPGGAIRAYSLIFRRETFDD